MNIDDLTIGQARELAALFSADSTAVRIDAHLVGKPVVIRTYSAGVHIGILAERNGPEVRLTDTRRLWKWTGAFTLSEVASNGVKTAKMPVAQGEIILTECIEIIPMSSSAWKQLSEIKPHEV